MKVAETDAGGGEDAVVAAVAVVESFSSSSTLEELLVLHGYRSLDATDDRCGAWLHVGWNFDASRSYPASLPAGQRNLCGTTAQLKIPGLLQERRSLRWYFLQPFPTGSMSWELNWKDCSLFQAQIAEEQKVTTNHCEGGPAIAEMPKLP
jgi:hypothetical protein